MTTEQHGDDWQLDAIYSILVECCGASEDERADCLKYLATTTLNGHEWRFRGWLGFGGKLYVNSQGVYVDCYPEQKSPLKVANERIEAALAAREEPPRDRWVLESSSIDGSSFDTIEGSRISKGTRIEVFAAREDTERPSDRETV